MENITFQNIGITGIAYNKIISLCIMHNVGEHAYAALELEVTKEYGLDFITRADESMTVSITTQAKEQHKVLFAGCVQHVSIQEMSDYVVLNINLVSASSKLDLKKKSKTYQNTGSTYGEIMEKAAGNLATVAVNISDKATGGLVMQYEETDWRFIKRMASQLGAMVFTSIDSLIPEINIGAPVIDVFAMAGQMAPVSHIGVQMPVSKPVTVSNGFTLMGVPGAADMQKTDNTVAASTVQSEAYHYIGERMSVNGTSYIIGSVSCTMEVGVLKCTYGLGNGENFKSVAETNNQLAGRMFLGEVKAVKGDQVQVHFSGIDDSYDAGGDKWFPYSTVYSSSDGSGFYCMPEQGDMVRVFIPSNNEKDAFVASAVNSNPQSNTRDKCWKAPGGKEILLTDDGIYIICEGEKIYINLSSDQGIEIHSDKPVRITSDSDITLQAGGEIKLNAETCINMAVGNSSIYMDGTQIQMGADGVYIN